MCVSRAVSIVVLLAFIACAGDALGQTTLVANLNNFNEPSGGVLGTLMPTLTTGEPRPASFGTATFTLSADMMSMTMVAEINNIDFTGSQTADTNDNLAAAHIHAGPSVTATTTGGVVWGFFGAPFHDNNPNDQVVTPFASGVGGTITGKWDAPEGNSTTLAAQLDHILNGRAYVNFHTSQFGGGEIRGTILVVPEPGTILLALFGATVCLSRRPTR